MHHYEEFNSVEMLTEWQRQWALTEEVRCLGCDLKLRLGEWRDHDCQGFVIYDCTFMPTTPSPGGLIFNG